MLEPYSDDPSTSGVMSMSEKQLDDMISSWWELGDWGVVSQIDKFFPRDLLEMRTDDRTFIVSVIVEIKSCLTFLKGC